MKTICCQVLKVNFPLMIGMEREGADQRGLVPCEAV
jgi:hypothetical protein